MAAKKTVNKNWYINSWMNRAGISNEEKNVSEEVVQNEIQEESRELRAVQDMRQLLELLEIKIKGEYEKSDERVFNTNKEQWKESIEILKNYLEKSRK